MLSLGPHGGRRSQELRVGHVVVGVSGKAGCLKLTLGKSETFRLREVGSLDDFGSAAVPFNHEGGHPLSC